MSKPLSGQRPPVKQAQHREHREGGTRRRDQTQLAAKRKRNVMIIIVSTCIVVVGFVAGVMALTSALAPSTNTKSTNQLAPPVDNIECNGAEQLAFHIHAHLSMYIDGQSMPLPANIGIMQPTCLYWLHTHNTDGIIHMEAPKVVKLNLGTFLKVWRNQLSQLQYPTQLSSTTGWTAYVDGKPYSGDFNKIELKPHELITLAYNSPNAKPDAVYSWAPGL